MGNKILIICLLLLITFCVFKSASYKHTCEIIKEKTVYMVDSLVLNERIAPIIQEYMAKHRCDLCYNEIFVDMKTPSQISISISSGGRSQFIKNPHLSKEAIMYFYINGVKFHLFTGIESLFQKKHTPSVSNYTMTHSECPVFSEWRIVIQNDSISVVDKNGDNFQYYPFTELVPIQFIKTDSL